MVRTGSLNNSTALYNGLASLSGHLASVSSSCTECGLCVKECRFLREYGTPKAIADRYDPGVKLSHTLAFECSLCGLCAAVCPMELRPDELFLAMRRTSENDGSNNYNAYKRLLNYEKLGTSRRFTHYALPAGCDTILFPGCALPGTRPNTVLKLYALLKQDLPSLGIVLDCCSKPSHDLGRKSQAHAMLQEMLSFILSHGVRNILVACPNCYKRLKYQASGLSVRTVFEVLAENGSIAREPLLQTVTVHDPCPLRFETGVHTAVRNLITGMGINIEEMPYSRTRTLCCGEGGAVGFINSALANEWKERRKEEASGRRIITYCAGCASLLNPVTPTSHILDVLFNAKAALNGKATAAKPPLTYWNRLRIKNKLKKTVVAAVSRERPLPADQNFARHGWKVGGE